MPSALDRVNKTQVVHAALFDLLTSQCDRHAQVQVWMQVWMQKRDKCNPRAFPTLCVPLSVTQNIFFAEDGGIKLIDNERAFYENHWWVHGRTIGHMGGGRGYINHGINSVLHTTSKVWDRLDPPAYDEEVHDQRHGELLGA